MRTEVGRVTGKLQEAGTGLGNGLCRETASHSRSTRAAGDPRPRRATSLSPGPQTLTQTYLLVAVVRSLLLNAVGELGARIFGVVPCGRTWKQVQKRKVTPFTDGFQAAAKMSLFPPSPLISSLPHLHGPLPARPTGKAGPICQICRKAFSLYHWYFLTNTQDETSEHKLALIAKTCT